MGDYEPSEFDIHSTVLEWVEIQPKIKRFRKLFIHIPNEGKRSYAYARGLKKLGMRKGVYDLFVAYQNHGYPGAWIELKRKDGRLSVDQKIFKADMDEQGYFTAECYSVDDAIKIIEWYFDINDENRMVF